MRTLRLKLTKRDLLIAFVLVSYVASIICNFYLLRSIDRDYSDLIDHSVPALSQLNKATASAAYSMHLTYPSLFKETAPNHAQAIQAARNALSDELKWRSVFVNANGIGVKSDDVAELQNAGDEFSRLGNEVVGLFDANRFAEANTLREDRFRPAMERYLGVTKRLADLVTQEGEQTNDRLTANTQRRSLAILGIGGWPFVAVVGAILMLLVLGVVVTFLMPEQP